MRHGNKNLRFAEEVKCKEAATRRETLAKVLHHGITEIEAAIAQSYLSCSAGLVGMNTKGIELKCAIQ